VRVHNLTDVSTSALQGASLVNVSIKLTDEVTVEPGKFTDVRAIPPNLSRLLKLEALFIGAQPPAKYLAAKEKLQPKLKAKAPQQKKYNVESKIEVSTGAEVKKG
jgi:hypothetical protein